MGAPIRTSSDIPDFSTYPSSPSDQLPSASESSVRLNEVAAQVGTRLGEGMVVVNSIRDQALGRIGALRESLADLYCAARDRSVDMAQEKLDMVRGQSQEQLRRAKQYAEARPLAVIAAAGVAGLLLGIGARAWRENRG